MNITKYILQTDKQGIRLKIAVAADLHTKNPNTVIGAIEQIKPDIIISTGDMFECFEEKNTKRNKRGFEFFELAVKIAPVYYCFGNHETEGEEHDDYPDISGRKSVPQNVLDTLAGLGVHTVFDSYECFDENIFIGGLLSARNKENQMPNFSFADEFANLCGYKILICHHPEYYEGFLKNKDFDMILSGHAHGGQWRFFGRGLIAPGQGLFPKYTSGIHDGKLIISRGCGNHTRPLYVPRIFNPLEVLEIQIKTKA